MKSILKFLTFVLPCLIIQSSFAQITAEKEVLTKGHEVYCIAYSQDGSFVATGGGDETVVVYNTATWETITTLKGFKDLPLAITFSNDGKLIAACGKDNKIHIWDLASKQLKLSLTGHKKKVMDIEFTPDDKFIASASVDKTIKLWNVANGELSKSFIGHEKEVTCLSISPNGDELVSGSADETLIIWDVKSASPKKTIMAHKNWIFTVQYSPDGSLIASAGIDRQIQLWDATSGKKLNTFLGHKKWVQTLAFSPDGNYLLSGGHDNTILLTDLKTGKMAFKSKKQSNYILSVAFNPNGETFASSELFSKDMQVWNARSLGIKPLDKLAAQKMSAKSGMIPKVTWISPTNGSVLNIASAKINANIQSESSLRSIELYVNGELFASKDRSELMLETNESNVSNYIETAILQEGENTLLIKAENIVGEGVSEEIKVSYKEKETKLITWLNPATDMMETQMTSFPINVMVAQAKSEQTIHVMVNNITQQTIPMPSDGGMLTKNINLKAGTNLIKLLVQTSEGTKEGEARTINLKLANKPLVSWISPTTDTLSNISSCRIKANILSEIPLTKVSIITNGIYVYDKIDLNESNLIIDQQIQLPVGVNSIQVKASNSSGESLSANRIITYELPEIANISWVYPSGNNTVYAAMLEANACIQTKKNVSKVQIFNNGIVVSSDENLTVATEGECKIDYKRPVMLNQGVNLLKVVAETASGTVSTEEIIINYVIPQMAVIKWISPLENEVATGEGTISISACVTSATPLSEVTVLVNEQIISTTPNPQKTTETCAFNIEQIIPLVKGKNNIIIKAKNAAGEVLSTPVIVDHKKFNPYRFALIIGNEDYSSYQAELESESDVDFALNDARAFRKTCEDEMGIASDNIIYLENARYIQMRKALKKINGIIEVTNGKAEVIVYYAGHGFPDEKTKEPYLVPVDGSGNDLEFSAIKLSYFYNQLTQHPSQRITVFLDACFSGGARNQGLVAARGVKVVPKETKAAVKKKLIVFTASSGNQTSLPYSDKKHGMFTYFLVKKIKEGGSDLTYKQLSDYIKEQVAIKSFMVNSKKQEPQTNISPEVESEWKTWTFK